MRTFHHSMKGTFRLGLRVALEEALVGFSQRSDVRMARGWNLFMLLPRMMLHKPPRGDGVPSKKLEERANCSRMASGRSCWREVFPVTSTPTTCPHEGVDTRRTALRREQNDPEILSTSVELSAARIALEGAQVAPGTLATWRELTNPERRPPRPRNNGGKK